MGTRARRTPSRPRHAVTAAALFLLSVVLYAGSLGHGFVWDDRDLIVENPAVRSLDGGTVARVFTEGFWRVAGRDGAYYRPVVALSYHVDHRLFGGRPWGFHARNVVLNALVVVLVYTLGVLALGDPVGAAVAALLFAVHPVHTENVAWIAGRTDLAATFWTVASVCAYLAFRRGRSPAWALAALGAGAVALLSKEAAVVLPALVALVELVVPAGATGGRRVPARGVRWAVVAGYGVLTLAYLALRHEVLGAVGTGHAPYAAGWVGRAALAFSILAGYVGRLLWPMHLSAEYDAPVPASPADPHVVAGVLAAAAIVAAAVRWRRHPAVPLGLGWFVLALGPVLNLVPIGEISAERFLYLPSVGAALVAGRAAAPAVAALRPPRGDGRVTAGAAALVVVLAALAVRTVTRVPVWRDERTLFTTTARDTPESARAHLNVGNVAMREGRWQDAERAFREAIARRPDYPDALSNLAGVYTRAGRTDEARRLLERALRAAPGNARLLANLGVIALRGGDEDGARRWFARALERDPGNADARFGLGVLLARRGEAEAARRHLEVVAGRGGRFALADYHLAVIAAAAGRADEARRYARRFLSKYPRDDAYRRRAARIAGGG